VRECRQSFEVEIEAFCHMDDVVLEDGLWLVPGVAGTEVEPYVLESIIGFDVSISCATV
jgi:hypothetical protein